MSWPAVRTHRQSGWPAYLGLALIVSAGLTLRVWGLAFGLPHDFVRPDEEKIVGPALGIAAGDLNPHLFLYPSLFLYLTASVYAILPSVDPFLVARALAAVAGTATIAVLYGAARERFSRRAALAAAAFSAVVFLMVRDSHFGVTDVPAAFLTVCAFWAAMRCAARGVTPRRVAVAGLLTG